MRGPHSTGSAGASQTPTSSGIEAVVRPLPSGKFRVTICFGRHPITGKPVRSSRTFATEHEALTFRDAMLRDGSSALARVRRQLSVVALPPPPAYPGRRMYLIRGHSVMLDADVAAMFGTRTGWLNQAVSRNRRRFPEDFAFRLTRDEVAGLRALGAIKPPGQGGRRSLPRVFTEEGLLMVAAILKSTLAAKINIEVVRTVCAAGPVPGLPRWPETAEE